MASLWQHTVCLVNTKYLFLFRFSVVKQQAISGLILLPAAIIQRETDPKADSFLYFLEDLPQQETLQQELDLWVVSKTLSSPTIHAQYMILTGLLNKGCCMSHCGKRRKIISKIYKI